MVIFHSYVKLPEGNRNLSGEINTTGTHRTHPMWISLKTRRNNSCRLEATIYINLPLLALHFKTQNSDVRWIFLMPHCVFLLNDALSSSQTMGEDEALVFPRETLSDKQEEQNRFQHIQNWLESMESRYWKSIIPIKLGIHLIKIY